MLVFPEYGVTGFMDGPKMTRESVYPFFESLPNWFNGTCDIDCSIPIVEGREIQHSVACMAKKYNMYITANFIEARYCEVLQDHHCPYDNHYLFNTNAVFNPKGCLQAKYYKTHTVEEEPERLNKPLKPDYVYFDIPEYGRFGTATCADGIFRNPVVDLVEKYEIDHLIFPMAWHNNFTHTWSVSTGWQLAVAARYNISVIASNLHDPKYYYQGSGIYHSLTALNVTYNNEQTTSTLITADLPIPNKYRGKVTPPRKVNPSLLKQKYLLGRSSPKPDGQVTIYNDVYNAVILTGLSGSISVCHNEFCCALNYSRNSTEDLYILAAFKGLHTRRDILKLENCIVNKCPGKDLQSCSERQDMHSSRTRFNGFQMGAVFSTEYVYPSVLPLNYAYLSYKWQFDRRTNLQNFVSSYSETPFVAVSLVGRVFD